MTFLLSLAVALSLMAGIAGVAILIRLRRENVSGWTHVGAPPPGADIALRLLEALAPGPVRGGGTVEWVPESFDVNGVRAAGVMLSARPVHVRVEWWTLVEATALAHEVGHAWRRQLGLRDGDGDPVFVEWVERANRVIAAALGGAR